MNVCVINKPLSLILLFYSLLIRMTFIAVTVGIVFCNLLYFLLIFTCFDHSKVQVCWKKNLNTQVNNIEWQKYRCKVSNYNKMTTTFKAHFRITNTRASSLDNIDSRTVHAMNEFISAEWKISLCPYDFVKTFHLDGCA